MFDADEFIADLTRVGRVYGHGQKRNQLSDEAIDRICDALRDMDEVSAVLSGMFFVSARALRRLGFDLTVQAMTWDMEEAER